MRDAALDGAFADEAIIGLTQDATGALLAFTDRGRLLRRAGGRLVPARVAGLPASPGFAITTGSDGTIWLGFKGAGVVRIRPGDTVATRLTARDGLADDNAFALLAARDGTIWVGTATGVSRIAGGRAEPLRLDAGRGFAPTTQIAEDSDGGVWIGTLGAGLYRYANDSVTHIPDGALSNNHVECLYVDAEGSVWVGTRHGLNRFRRVRLLPLTTMNGLPIDAPGAIAIDSMGALWMSSQLGGLYRRAHADSGPFLPVALPTRTSPVITSMFAGAHGALWVGTRASGLLRYAGAAWHTYPISGSVNALLEDSRGQVWVGTPHGLTRLGGPTHVLADSAVESLTQDRRGAIWAGTSAGLSRIDASGVKNYGAGHVLALHTDADGVVWAGTTGGLVRVTDEGQVTLRSENGIVPELVAAIGEDRDGYLWLGGYRGLQRMARAELSAVADSVARRRPAVVRSILEFLPVDGLPSPEVTAHVQRPTAVAPNGRLWFSMERGLVSFDPSALRRDSVPPLVHIERVGVDGVAMRLDAPITISPAARRVEFRYTGVSLNDGPGVRFRYRLDGFDTTWVNAGAARAASFTRLSPGRYRFRVMARAADGPWSASSEGIAFRVLPPFYETWWFVASVVIGLVAVFTVALHARTAVLEGRFAAVLAERTRLAREIHDTLLQGFTGVALALRAATRRS
jgi:ligand-binding sensor domain-containing protein